MSARNLTWLAVTLLLAACAQRPWTREGTSAEELAADQRACELAATQEVQRRWGRSVSAMGPAVVGGRTGAQSRRFNTTPQGPFADQYGTQLAEEDRLVAECMRGRGYERLRPN